MLFLTSTDWEAISLLCFLFAGMGRARTLAAGAQLRRGMSMWIGAGGEARCWDAKAALRAEVLPSPGMLTSLCSCS